MVAVEPGSAMETTLRSKHPDHPPPDITPDTVEPSPADKVEVLDHVDWSGW